MARFTATSIVDATPEQVLEVLTDPEEIRSWSPIPFEVDEFGGRRLHSGSVARVSGSLAGRRVGFDVAVHAADSDGHDDDDACANELGGPATTPAAAPPRRMRTAPA